jgi:hypothetical protein
MLHFSRHGWIRRAAIMMIAVYALFATLPGLAHQHGVTGEPCLPGFAQGVTAQATAHLGDHGAAPHSHSHAGDVADAAGGQHDPAPQPFGNVDCCLSHTTAIAAAVSAGFARRLVVTAERYVPVQSLIGDTTLFHRLDRPPRLSLSA